MIFRAAFCLVRLRSPDKKQAIRGSAPASFFRFTPERLRAPTILAAKTINQISTEQYFKNQIIAQ